MLQDGLRGRYQRLGQSHPSFIMGMLCVDGLNAQVDEVDIVSGLRQPRLSGWIARMGATILLALTLAGCAEVALNPLGPTPSATSGALRLTIDHATYTLTTPIGVTVTNTGGTDLYALDGRSGCAIVQLQQYDSSTSKWVSIVGCSQATSPRADRIAAGVSIPFTLAPASSADPNKWDRGLYRVAVAFSSNSDATTDGSLAFSAGFTIS